jgi:hypothetical protein
MPPGVSFSESTLSVDGARQATTSDDHRYVPIGGILAPIRANLRVLIDGGIRSDGGFILAGGCIQPPLPDTSIVLEVTGSVGRSELVHSQTNSDGCYEVSIGVGSGVYTAQVFTASTPEGTEAETAPIKVVV